MSPPNHYPEAMMLLTKIRCMTKNKWGAGSLAALLLIFMASCAEDVDISNKPLQYTDHISFGMTMPEDWNSIEGTRTVNKTTDPISSSSRVTEPVAFEQTIDGDTITIYAIVEDITATLDTLIQDSVKNTRASAVPNEYDLGVYAYVMNKTEAPYDGANTGIAEYMNNTHLDVSDDYSYSPVKYWPGSDYSLKFFAYSPHIANANNIIGTGQTNFNVSHTANIPSISYTVPAEVSKQLDLTICNHEMLAGDNRQQINFKMNHIMSAVKVKAGAIPEGNISHVSFSHINHVGTRLLNASQWDVEAGASAFTQSFEPALVPTYGTQMGQTFYFLPQQFTTDEAKIEVKLTIDTREYILTKSLKSILGEGASWQEGKQYTFVITTPEEIKVEVDDALSDNTQIKSDFEITNTGLAPIYARATIVGNWVVENTDRNGEIQYHIVAGWKSTDGIFDWGTGGEPTTSTAIRNWQKGNDGYYYYTKPIAPGESVPSTDKLFETYTLTAAAPVANALLDLTIAVQAVIANDITTMRTNGYWDNTITY